MNSAVKAPASIDRPEVERALVRASLADFLERVYIPDPPPEGKGWVKFVKWPHIMRLDAATSAVVPSGALPVLKSRKLGVTSYFEARFTHNGLFLPGSFMPVISQGEKEAVKIIADCKFIWGNLPEHLRGDLVTDNTTTIKFKGGGTIEAFPSTAKAGRSFTGTEILMDEGDFHDSFGANYDALLPLIQDTGGKLFMVSTADPARILSDFRTRYRESENRLFLGYYDRPGRTDETYAQAQELASDQGRFEKENARTEGEALAPTKALAFFDRNALQYALEGDATEPISRSQGDRVLIWRKKVIAGRYVGGGDTAWGMSGSRSIVPLFDYTTKEQMACIHGLGIHPDEMAQLVLDTCVEYNNAYLCVETAGRGFGKIVKADSVVLVDKLVDLGYGHRMYHRGENWGSDLEDRGWVTNPRNRDRILGELEEAIRNREVIVRCREAIGEMMSFIRNPAGRPEASAGARDDHVLAIAFMWQMVKHGHATFMSPTAPPGMPSPLRRHFLPRW